MSKECILRVIKSHIKGLITCIVLCYIVYSCSKSKSGDDNSDSGGERRDSSSERRDVSSERSEDEKDAILAALIVNAARERARAEANKPSYPGFNPAYSSQRGPTTWECIYCGEERKSEMVRDWEGKFKEVSPNQSYIAGMGVCPESSSGKHRFRRVRD